ncbi:MAG TPA: polyprenyl synthetase family protein [Chitinophagales bacterium]|nr:polyprenyl synthetase family protein [Chitinophagales bacterium]
MHSPQQLLQLFEEYRSKHSFHYSPEELYEPIRYILDLGGKRMRPLLVLMGCDLFSGTMEDALPAAYAMELFHNFTLVHDDIMDNASLRRNKPTVHEKFGIPRAILSGDVMILYVYKFLQQLEPEKFHKVITLFNSSAIRVCEGQQYDWNFQNAREVSVKDYLKMIEFKTAALLSCSLEVGAIIADADEVDAHHLFEFGRNIGICFQLLDDLLDAFGEQGKFGKKIGGDVAQNKKTYLHIKALELAGGEDKEKLIFYSLNNVPSEEKVKHILEIYRKLGVEKIVRDEALKFHSKALDNLKHIKAGEQRKQVLHDFAEALFKRQM